MNDLDLDSKFPNASELVWCFEAFLSVSKKTVGLIPGSWGRGYITFRGYGDAPPTWVDFLGPKVSNQGSFLARFSAILGGIS